VKPSESIASLADTIRRGETTAVATVEAAMERIEQQDSELGCFHETYHLMALEAAKETDTLIGRGDSPGPLAGVPIAIKDNIVTDFGHTTCGSKMLEHYESPYTATAVQRLLDAGAIVIGKTRCDEFAMGSSGENSAFGPTRNPIDPSRVPGGSSSGSAAAVADFMCAAAFGTQTGGSVLRPSAYCGVVGFKPPHGRVPEESPYNLDWYCHEGPLARTVADCALMENVMAGPHELDLASLWPKLEIPAALEGIGGWRIAYSMDLGYCQVDPEVVRTTEAALDHFRALGCEVVEVKLGWTSATLGAAQSHLGHIFGNRIARELPLHRDLMTHDAIKFSEFGRTTTADDFIDAMTLAGEMYDTLGPILESHNVLVCPTTGLPAVPAEHDSGIASLQVNGVDVDPEWGWLLTYPFNMLSRCPVMSVPSGRATNGVPTGIQIVGRGYDDVSVFRAAAAYEAARGGFELPAS